jgi:hypothetical protein
MRCQTRETAIERSPSHDGQHAMGGESRIVTSHGQIARVQHVNILEVPHGDLYPEAHDIGLKKKKGDLMGPRSEFCQVGCDGLDNLSLISTVK